MYKVLYDFDVDFIAEHRVILENTANSLSFSDARVQEEIQILVQEHLILLVAQAKVLEKVVSETHQLVHPNVLLRVIWNLKQVQYNRVNANVSQKPLFVLPWFD